MAAEPKIAIVHDWFVGGGAEQVVEQLHQLYPKAPIYTAYCSPQWRQRLASAQIITSYMQRWPLPALRKFLPPLRAWWFSHLDLSQFDLVISSSGAEAKAVRTEPKQKLSVRVMHLVGALGASEDRKGAVQNGTATADRSSQHRDPAESPSRAAGSAGRPAGAVHISYCHAPTHYYWSRYDDYIANPGFGRFDWLARLGLKILLGPMRRWDYKAAQRPTYIIANSNYIKDQIKKYYDRDSVVIHPPVDVARFAGPAEEPRRGFIITGRQTPYKRADLAVVACTELELPLIVIGDGPQHSKLEKLAGKSVTFLRGKSDEELAHYLQTSLAYIFPGLDDFGIAAVEALAAGTPVLAYQAGGALDYIQPGSNGQFFKDQTVESLTQALKIFKPDSYSPAAIQKSAAVFTPEQFKTQITSYIKKVTA